MVESHKALPEYLIYLRKDATLDSKLQFMECITAILKNPYVEINITQYR